MKRIHRVRLVCALILGLAFQGCLPESTAVLSQDDEILDDFIDEYYRERFAFYPAESTLAGFPGHDDELEQYDGASISQRIAWLADFRLRLIAVRVEDLSRFAHPEALWLRSEVEAELWHLEQWAPWKHQADFYLLPARSGLRSLLTRSASEIVNPLLGRLEGFVRLCDSARENLDSMSSAERQSSLGAIRRTEALLVGVLNRVLPDVRDHERHELRASRDAALNALRALRSQVGALPEAKTRRALGEAAFRKYWIYQAMVDLSTAEMEEMTQAEIQRLRGEIEDTMLSHFPGETLASVLARLVSLPPPSEPIAEVTALVELLSQSSTPLGRIRIENMTRVGESADVIVAPRVVRVLHPPPLEPIAEGAALVSTEGSANAAGWVRTMAEAAHDLVGEAVQNEYRARSMSLLRKVGSVRTSREGWALLVQSRMLRDAADGQMARWPSAAAFESLERLRPTIELFVLREALIEQARLLASIRFHRDRIDEASIRELFARDAYLEPRDIDAQWLRVELDPGIGSAALGMILLQDLERDFRRKYPTASETMFYEKFLQAGVLPIRLVRYRLIGGDDALEPLPGLGLRPLVSRDIRR